MDTGNTTGDGLCNYRINTEDASTNQRFGGYNLCVLKSGNPREFLVCDGVMTPTTSLYSCRQAFPVLHTSAVARLPDAGFYPKRLPDAGFRLNVSLDQPAYLMSVPLPFAKTENPQGDGADLTPAGRVVPMSDAVKRSGVNAPRPAVILVVDDDTSVLIAARRILAKYGYTVLEAPGGEEALQIAQENAQRIDVVLTDVRMPGLDGPSLVRKLADVLPTLRVVYMSGYTDGRLDQELPAPGRAFLSKPFTVEQLTRTLADILG